MITFKMTDNFAIVAKQFEAGMTKRAQAAMAEALNHTALGLRKDLYDEMRSVFHNPTAYTLKSLYVKRATPGRLQSVVWLKNNYDDRKQHYLHPQIFGGARVEKRHEFLLRRIGVLPSGMYAVPGNSATLDAHGNMSRGEIVKILSYFQAFYLAGSTQNSTKETRDKMSKGSAKKKGMEYIVIKQKRGGMVPGVWKVERGGLGRSIRPVMIFVRQPSYGKRFHFEQVGQASVDARFPSAWNKAWASTKGMGS